MVRRIGVRSGEPFVEMATFARTLEVLLARAVVEGPPGEYSFWGLHRDDELLVHWSGGTDEERTANEARLAEIQIAARRLLRLNPIRTLDAPVPSGSSAPTRAHAFQSARPSTSSVSGADPRRRRTRGSSARHTERDTGAARNPRRA
jgi:hypothetical protein